MEPTLSAVPRDGGGACGWRRCGQLAAAPDELLDESVFFDDDSLLEPEPELEPFDDDVPDDELSDDELSEDEEPDDAPSDDAAPDAELDDFDDERLSVLKKPEPLKVTPTGVKTFLTGRTSPDSGWAISVSVSSLKPCWTSIVSPESTNL